MISFFFFFFFFYVCFVCLLFLSLICLLSYLFVLGTQTKRWILFCSSLSLCGLHSCPLPSPGTPSSFFSFLFFYYFFIKPKILIDFFSTSLWTSTWKNVLIFLMIGVVIFAAWLLVLMKVSLQQKSFSFSFSLSTMA